MRKMHIKEEKKHIIKSLIIINEKNYIRMLNNM